MKSKRITTALLALILALLLMAAFPAGDAQPATLVQPIIPVTGRSASAYPPPPVDLSAYPPPVDLKDPSSVIDDSDSLVTPEPEGDNDDRERLPKVYD